MSSIVDKLELSAAITSNENKSNDDNDVKLNINTEETKNQRLGLTTQDAEDAYKTWGYNELPCVVIPLWYVFMRQFTGVMPYTMEICVLVAAGCQSWPDFGIIIAMLIINAILGFREELNSARALAELTNKLEKRVATLRDGKVEQMATRLLVPGDIVLLVGGVEVPADIDWIEGDVLAIDTAALTGEPLPRKYPSDLHGTLILAGTTVRAGEAYGIVRKTGINTEIGSAQSEIMKDKSSARSAVFEDRVVQIVQFVIIATLVDVLIIFFVQGFATGLFYSGQTADVFLACLGIVIASVPTALPLLWQITMSLGSTKMAREFSCVVTSQAALLDISCMSVLCSDKTGTLTTARISINADQVWLCGDFTKADLALYAGLASSRDKTEDAIDRSVIGYVDRIFGKEEAMAAESQYTKTRAVGFNPIYKRVLFEFFHPTKGTITVVKGLPNKVLDTTDGGIDDATDQWQCENCDELKPIIKKVDFNFSKVGYKTLGVAVKINDGPFKYVGVLPMLDPPRHDTAETLRNLQNAGIEVKMITGDHLNIARETARLIGLGQNIHAGSDIRIDDVSTTAAHHTHMHTHAHTHDEHGANTTTSATTNTDGTLIKKDRATEIAELIHRSNGFAQVLPKDKREVVVTLKEKYGYVVGMTGDGVNDAPALSAAQCGIAVDDATDAAKNAAAIILTTPGLSAIYGAVVESRKIFRKLKSYAVYRVAATIQIVLVLTLLIYISNCTIQSIYIVLLALFNDVTLLPIAYDFQVASKAPESPNVRNLLILATILGCCQTGITMFFAYGIPYISIFQDSYTLTRRSISLSGCDEQTQAIIWIQVFIATEILAFSARAPSYFFLCHLPTWPLTAGIFIGCLIICLIANQSSEFGSLPSSDIALVWVWNIFWLFVVDAVKVQVLLFLNESTEILPELVLQGDVFTSAKSLHESTPTNDHTNASASGDVNGINSVVMNESTTMIGILPNQDTIYDTIINQSSDIYSDDDCTADDIESYAFKQREISQLGKLAISDGSSRKLGLDQLSVNVLNGSISVRGFSRSSRSLLSSQASF